MKKIIFIIRFSTAPDEYKNQEPPRFYWTKSDGSIIGIWGLEWGEILMDGLIKYNPEYTGEVWKPELGADRIYSANLSERLISRKFPAQMKRFPGFYNSIRALHSAEIINWIESHDNPNTVFMLPVTKRCGWIDEAMKSISKAKIIHYNFLNSSLMLPSKPLARKTPTVFKQILINKEKHRRIKKILNLLTMNDNPQALASLQKLYPSMNIFYFMWGYDLDYWQSVLGKSEARQNLDIPQDKFVFLLSQRLSPEYQVDKVIEVLASLKGKQDFICYVTGHGTQEYESYLQDVVTQQNMQDRVRFVGFVDDDTLRKYFEAADLFINLPVNSAGSASALKASMCGCPVMIVPTGALYEFLNSEDAGIFVDPQDYDSWASILQKVTGGDVKVGVPSRQALANYFSWEKNIKDLKYAIEKAR